MGNQCCGEVKVKENKHDKRRSLNDLGGHDANKDQANLHGVLTLQIGQAKNLKGSFKYQERCCMVSFGNQTFKSEYVCEPTNPSWSETCHVWVDDDQVTSKMQISVFADRKVVVDDLVGLNYLSIKDVIEQADKSGRKDVNLECELYPESVIRGQQFEKSESLGTFTLKATYVTRGELIHEFWKSKFALAGATSEGLNLAAFDEVVELVASVYETNVPDTRALFKDADVNNDSMLSVEELVNVMDKYPGFLSNFSLYTFAVQQHNELVSANAMKGGYMSKDHAAAGMAFQASEWMGFKGYGTSLNVGKDAAFIIVWDRERGVNHQEKLSGAINLSMRTMYQTVAGRVTLMLPTTTALMKEASVAAGRMEDSKESKSKIPKFIKTMYINTDEMAKDEEDFASFNEFFMRHLKPGSRPIFQPNDPKFAVQPCDCRLGAFASFDQCSKFWVKGKKFTVENLLQDKKLAQDFAGGSLIISRLAPQDYHRFHSPVDGTVVSITPEYIGTQYWTVNPIAVNSPVDVFTNNIRKYAIIDSPQFGKVAFICVGATLVGSIVFNEDFKVGAQLKRGQDLGSYKFGGSTCITIFQKNSIEFDKDLTDRSVKMTETLVKMGTSLGKCVRQ